jgi:hypothetical protein
MCLNILVGDKHLADVDHIFILLSTEVSQYSREIECSEGGGEGQLKIIVNCKN